MKEDRAASSLREGLEKAFWLRISPLIAKFSVDSNDFCFSEDIVDRSKRVSVGVEVLFQSFDELVDVCLLLHRQLGRFECPVHFIVLYII